jgi:hypothetical protein
MTLYLKVGRVGIDCGGSFSGSDLDWIKTPAHHSRTLAVVSIRTIRFRWAGRSRRSLALGHARNSIRGAARLQTNWGV